MPVFFTILIEQSVNYRLILLDFTLKLGLNGKKNCTKKLVLKSKKVKKLKKAS